MKNKIVLVGIGGAGMSGLAGLFLELGYENIIGVDKVNGIRCRELQEQGVEIIVGHGNYEVQPEDFVIYSQATNWSPEVKQATKHFEDDYIQSPPPMLYSEFLGEISKYLRTIAITGTHGKTTTTGLTAHALQQTSKDFGIGIVGSTVTDRNNTGYFLNTDHKKPIKKITDHIFSRKGPFVEEYLKKFRFVVEADEFNKHFLLFDSDYSIITNCEVDHIDTYKNTQTYLDNFLQFMHNTNHTIVVPSTQSIKNPNDNLQELINTYKKAPNTIAKLIETPVQTFNFKTLLGGHNHINASLAFTTLTTIFPEKKQEITNALNNFKGLGRRCEPIGKNAHNVPILSDYGHHPTEIESTMAMLREKYPDTHITVFFEVHQIVRLIEFRSSFGKALKQADKAYMTPVYHAREVYEKIQKDYPDHPIQNYETLTAFQKAAADNRNVQAITQEKNIVPTLQEVDQGIIVLFTAGKLDGIVREGI